SAAGRRLRASSIRRGRLLVAVLLFAAGCDMETVGGTSDGCSGDACLEDCSFDGGARCSGACRNLATDSQNCGRCNNACDVQHLWSCVAGACRRGCGDQVGGASIEGESLDAG